MPAANTQNASSLVTDFLGVCNLALQANRDSLPYRPLIVMFEKLFQTKQVECQIYEDESSDIKSIQVIELTGGGFRVVPGNQAEPTLRIKLKRAYMERVVEHRSEYVEHPERLDWDWFKTRLGIGS